VLLRSAVAPTYFPTYQGYADGGLSANAPIMCAVAQALDENTGKQNLENISLLSIGVGFTPTYISGKKLDWGLTQWAPNLVSIFTDSMKFVNEYQASKILKERFHRIDPFLDQPYKIDDASKAVTMIEIANKVSLDKTQEWVEKWWK